MRLLLRVIVLKVLLNEIPKDLNFLFQVATFNPGHTQQAIKNPQLVIETNTRWALIILSELALHQDSSFV